MIIDPDKLGLPEPGANDHIIGKVHEALAALENGNATKDQFLAAINIYDRLKEITKGLGILLDKSAVEFLNQHGDVTCGNIRYYVGTTTYTKCRDVKATLNYMLQISSCEDIAGCLASDGLKAGASRVLLGDAFDTHFSTEVRMEMKDGKPLKPKKSLQKVNMDFQPKKLKGNS